MNLHVSVVIHNNINLFFKEKEEEEKKNANKSSKDT